jgi:signal transduction histidine kinase
MAEFIEEMEVSAVLHAEGRGLGLTVDSTDGDVVICADRQLLASAVSNLLQNAFKFTSAGGHVVLAARATDDRVFIDVCDECGGLPPGSAGELFQPFVREQGDRAGLGLGLSIALSAVRANSGDVSVRDIPGKGCVFTISLPRPPDSDASVFHVLPDGNHSSAEALDRGAGNGARASTKPLA